MFDDLRPLPDDGQGFQFDASLLPSGHVGDAIVVFDESKLLPLFVASSGMAPPLKPGPATAPAPAPVTASAPVTVAVPARASRDAEILGSDLWDALLPFCTSKRNHSEMNQKKKHETCLIFSTLLRCWDQLRTARTPHFET